VLPTYVSVFSLVLAGTGGKVLKYPLSLFLQDISEISGGSLLSLFFQPSSVVGGILDDFSKYSHFWALIWFSYKL